ncbi:MAG: hypothetical protein M3R00_04340, partial [Pseudomonadota bacterium]|nr:hypothetical protein [Pseudomonadota bacterium]
MKKSLLALIILSATISLPSLAASTWYAIGYHSYNFLSGGGYKDTMISRNQAKITFRGNEGNTLQQCNAYVMKRASELAREQGFKSFIVVNRSSKMDLDYRPGIAAHSVPVPMAE